TSSGVFLRFARLCAGLAESGRSIRSAPLASARSAPFRFGTRTETTRPGSVFAYSTSSAVSASCGTSFTETNEPTSISRWPAAWAARIHAFLRLAGRTVRTLCNPSRRPTSRTVARSGKLGMRQVSGSVADRSGGIDAPPDVPGNAPVEFANPRAFAMEGHRERDRTAIRFASAATRLALPAGVGDQRLQ